MKTLSVVALAVAFPASAYIETLYPLQQFIAESEVIAEGAIEKVDHKRSLCTVRITKSIKGRCHYERVRLNIGAGQEWHPEAVMPHLVEGAPAVIFYNAERRAEIYINRFFLQLSGDAGQPADKAWWTFTHIEVHCNRTYNGTAEELSKLLSDIQAGKATPPAADPKAPPITKEAFKALPPWGRPVDPEKLPAPFVRHDPTKPRKSRDPENPAGVERGVAFQYFEGAWETLPDADSVKPLATGVAEQIDLAKRRRDGQYGFRFTGFIDIPREGAYRFSTGSDGASKLTIGKEEVGGEINLKAGKHALSVTFVQKSGAATLELQWEGPDLPKQKVPAAALSHLP
jgi:hypothetical protein